jgi:hypothetical protein
MELGRQRHAPAALRPGMTTVPTVQGLSGRLRKISLPPGFDPRTIQAVASRYTDWAILANLYEKERHRHSVNVLYTPRVLLVTLCIDFS